MNTKSVDTLKEGPDRVLKMIWHLGAAAIGVECTIGTKFLFGNNVQTIAPVAVGIAATMIVEFVHYATQQPIDQKDVIAPWASADEPSDKSEMSTATPLDNVPKTGEVHPLVMGPDGQFHYQD